jgi:hypothetical protein
MEPIDGLSRINKVFLLTFFLGFIFLFQSFSVSVEILSFNHLSCLFRTAGNFYATFAEFLMELVYRYARNWLKLLLGWSKHVMIHFLVSTQCSHPTCCVAYHPLCARAADLCVEVHYWSLCCGVFPSCRLNLCCELWFFFSVACACIC